MKITAPTPWQALFALGKNAALWTLVFIAILFTTELGDDMPDWVKIAYPVGCWVVLMGFFFAHRSPDAKSVEFDISRNQNSDS